MATAMVTRAKSKTANVQTASSIKRLKYPENVRAKSSMYLGEQGEQMVFRMGKEIYDNCCDEHLAGRNNQIVFFADNAKNEYIVADLAGGIPVDLDKVDKISMLTLIFTELHTGGKFEGTSYEASAGTHGVGAACVNAVSDVFEVWTFRDNKCYYQSFAKGVAKAKLAAGKVPKDIATKLGYIPKKGSIVRFIPDQTVVSVDKGKTVAKLDLKYVSDWLKNSAMFNKGLRVVYRPMVKGVIKEYEYINKVGLIEIVRKRLEECNSEASGKPIIYEEGNIRMCLQWSSYSEADGFKTYVSCSPTRDHGTHEVGFRAALVKALNKYKKPNQKFQPLDLYFGLIGIFDWRMSGAAFSSQVKDRLTSDISKEVEEKLLPIFEAAFAKNKALASQIIKRACDVKKVKEEIKKLMEGIAGVKRGRGSSLPTELTVAAKATPDTRVLYLVEGDSAGGCHFPETKVLLADGTKKTFADLVDDFAKGIDNYGIAWNASKSKPVKFKMYHPRITKTVTEYTELVLADGTVWRGTCDHPWLLTDGTYKRADALTEGDEIREVQQPLNQHGI